MLAKLVLNTLLKLDNNNFINKLIIKILYGIRKLLVQFNDSVLVKYEFEGNTILLPLRHDLPFVRKANPVYDSNIGRIAKYLMEKYPDLKAIDIGANVGDTAVVIKTNADIPLLCIEGEPFYFSLLKRNTTDFKDMFYAECLVGDSGKDNLNLISYKGSAKLALGHSKNSVNFRSLSSILNDYEIFNRIKFLKIDTDGFDCKIIRSNAEFIKEHKPVIFFEYDPYFLEQNNDDGLSVFELLLELGYENSIFYHNTGDLLLSLNINNRKILQELHLYYTGRNTEMYVDICVFHSEDADIAEKIRKYEYDYFLNYKSGKL